MIPDLWNGEFAEYPRKFLIQVAHLYYQKPGVYFLWKQGELQYIGQSENVAKRVRGHHVFRMSERRGWVVGVIPIRSRVRRKSLEKICIGYFTPPLNRQCNPAYKIVNHHTYIRRPVDEVFPK